MLQKWYAPESSAFINSLVGFNLTQHSILYNASTMITSSFGYYYFKILWLPHLMSKESSNPFKQDNDHAKKHVNLFQQMLFTL